MSPSPSLRLFSTPLNRDLDYSGLHEKPNQVIVLLYLVAEEILTIIKEIISIPRRTGYNP